MLQVSLVIPVRDESKTIEALLNSINAQTYQPAEIVFVDGGSVDGTLDKLRDLARQNERIRIIEAGEATPGRGRNVGITSARCEWVALTDAGIRLEPGWLEQLVKVVEQNSAIEVVYGNYEPVTDSRFERCAALAYPPPKQYRAGSRMRGPSIASVLMKREVWRAVGGLPDLRAAEDLIFMKRIEDQGFSIGWAPDATVWWQLQPTLARTFRKFVLYSRHNVWAGMQRFWHYGIARQYLVWSFFLVLAFVHSIWWLVVPGAGILARVAKSIWIRREGRGLFWAMNPGQFVGVMVILLTIDLATFIGWWQARWRPQPGTSCKQAINLLFIFLLAPLIWRVSLRLVPSPTFDISPSARVVVMHTLYLCYFGLREPLVQTQVLPYLRQLRLDNIDVSLLTFEPELTRRWSDEERLKWEDSLKSDGVNWTALPYHKKPTLPATLFDIAIGTLKALRMVRFEQVDVLHARTHVPLAMALLARKLTGCKVVFDIRGLIADEYVDAGLWREGSLVYRAIKWLERIGIREADQVIVLTELMRDWLTEQKLCSAEKIEVVPCCVDFSRFDHKSLEIERDHNDVDRFEVIYAGAVTGLYLLEEMGRFFLALREKRKDAFLRILTTSSAAEGKERLRRIGLDEKEFWIGKAHPAEVPGYLSRAKVGLSFRKTSFSQIAASPTKIPEYLAAGLPVVTNAGIGDSDQIIKSGRVGVVIDELNCEAYQRGVEELEDVLRDPTIVERCRKVARSRFDLEEVGGARYRRIYQRLAGVSSRRLTELPSSREVKV